MTTTPQFYYAGAPAGARAVSAVYLSAALALPTGRVLPLDTLQLVSVSSHREKFPVTALGRVGPRGFTRGHRLVAGTLGFAVVDRGAFTDVLDPLEAPRAHVNTADRVRGASPRAAFYDMKADELPPFDLHMVYATPEGLLCYEGLRGVDVVDEGKVVSIDGVGLAESFAYVAADRVPLQRLSTHARPTPLTPAAARGPGAASPNLAAAGAATADALRAVLGALGL